MSASGQKLNRYSFPYRSQVLPPAAFALMCIQLNCPTTAGAGDGERVYALHDESVEDFAEVPVRELPKGFPVSLCHRPALTR